MKTWIKLAIENGAELTIWKGVNVYFAMVKFHGNNKQTISATAEDDVESALDVLNEALQDDAADEINL